MADLKLEIDYSELVAAAKTTDQTKQAIRLLGQQFARTGDSSAYMRAVNQIVAAQKNLSVNARMSRSEIMKLAAQYKQTTVFADQLAQAQMKLNVATQRSNKGLARSGVVMQQTGYQVGDFLVQVQSGTNMFVAFGQQATQLAGLLTMSMNPKIVALGVALSIIIPLTTAVAAWFSRTGDAAKSTSGDVEDLTKSLESSRDSLKNAAKDLEVLQRGLRDTQELGFVLNIEAVQAEIVRLQAVVQAVNSSRSDGSGFARLGRAAIEREVSAEEEKLALLQEQLAAYQDILDRLEQKRSEERRAQFLAEQEQSLANQIILNQEIAKYGENSIKAEEERAYQAREAYEAELRRQGVIEDDVKLYMALYDEMVKSVEQADEATTKAEELARELDISVDYAQQLAGIGFGNIWNGANGASQLASNLALAARMAANYQGREAAFGGVRVGEPPIMTSEGIEVLPQTLAPRNNPFAGMELEDLLPPKEKTKGAEGPDAVERLREEIAFRQRTLNLSKEERNLQTEIFRITNTLGKDRNKYSSDFIENLAKQNLAIQEQERVIEEARQQQENLADSIANSFGDAFMSIVDGTKSVKDAFSDMARHIISRLFEILVIESMVQSIAGAITGAFGGGGGGPTRPVMRPTPQASGGYQMPGRPYLVGEHGPELVIPGRSGTVMNADLTNKAMGGESINIVNNINVTGGTDPAAIRQEVAKLMPQITNATKTAVIDARRRGGQMKAAFG